MTTIRGRRFRQMLAKNIATEREISISNITILNIESFNLNEWGHIGLVTVCYSDRGFIASYGYNYKANVSCYAD